MSTMPARPRILIIAAAALSIVIVGLADTLAGVRVDRGAACSVEGDSWRADRGTKAEEAGESDGDEEGGREVHLFASDALACRLDSVWHAATQPPPLCAAERPRRDALVRGPPTAR
ncbi:MAG: hypothetical protein ACKOZU_12875 [Planctomycetaceae bacterium]